MYSLTIPQAVAAVRKNLDESGLNLSMMYAPPTGSSEATDNDEMDATIARTIPEAVNFIIQAAPASFLEGVELSLDEEEYTAEGKVIEFSLNDEILRLVRMKAADTDQIVTDILSEASPEGRMQLNPSVRGTYDKPRLVQLVGGQNTPTFRYYSLKEELQTSDSEDQGEESDSSEDVNEVTFQDLVDVFEYLPPCQLERGTLYHASTPSQPASYDVPHDLVDKILYRLTGMVLVIYGENEKANYFNNLAIF